MAETAATWCYSCNTAVRDVGSHEHYHHCGAQTCWPATYAPHLIDSDTAEDMGLATPEQVAASDASEAKGQHGHIWIDSEGSVIPTGTYSTGPTRRVYTGAG